MTCKRCARTPAEAKRILAALRTLRVDDEDVTIRAWGDWIGKDGHSHFFKGKPLPVVENIGRKWCALNRAGYALIDARPENDEANHGNIEISWTECDD